MPTSSNINQLMFILATARDREYIGEPISQLEHALQAAYFAQSAGKNQLEILAALLHDIGHLVGQEAIDSSTDLGVKNHEEVGANFLAQMGLPRLVCDLVHSHVQAKRYLVYKNARYRAKLSQASLQTLLHQGGPMSDSEALIFEADPWFRAKIALRNYDEKAKVVGLTVPKLASYIPLLNRHLIA